MSEPKPATPGGLIHEPVVAVARAAITRMLRDLRYSQSVEVNLPIDTGQSEAEWLSELRRWVGAYSNRLDVATNTTTAMLTELNTLREQRSAIRAFLGITPTPKPFGD